MSINRTVLGITAGLLVLVGVMYVAIENKQEKIARTQTSAVSIEQTWELPKILEEVSGIAFMNDNRIACVQDEDGIIFIYNLKNSEIEEKIDFAGSGDYEGIAISETTAYVLRSDGTIYKVENFESNPEVTEHETPLSRKQDLEGLSHDPKNNRLLLAIKEKEPDTDDYKGIYAVDLQTMKMDDEPVFKLNLNDSIFDKLDEKKSHNRFKPSEININPSTGEYYMLEGQDPKLLILDSSGNPKNLYQLKKDDFYQPEGITFDPSGTIYISNEGNPATIHRISIK